MYFYHYYATSETSNQIFHIDGIASSDEKIISNHGYRELKASILRDNSKKLPDNSVIVIQSLSLMGEL